ncbi:MAG TPA: HNH endonuclease [Ktedonobacterales bacterium]
MSPGDFLYEVTVKEGALYLLSRLEIKTVETRTDSSPYPGETEADAQGYQAEAFQPMSLRRDNRVARAIVEQIQCKTQTGIKNLTFTPSGSGLLDKQTLRATRELTEESAALLNQVIATYEEGHLSEKELKKSGEVIQALRDEEGGFEGASSTKLVNHYERDVKLRAAAIRIHGTRCQACGFSFEETYGEHGADYIEVHHKRPISTYGGSIQVDPVTDMAVLCSNCHRMIHRNPPSYLTIEELRAIVTTAKTSGSTDQTRLD